jgi:hypothetical protein
MSSTRQSELTRKQRRERAREERRAQEAAQRRSAATRRRLGLFTGVAVALFAVILATVLALGGSGTRPPDRELALSARLTLTSLASLGSLRSPGPPGPLGPEGVPTPNAAPAAGTARKAGGEPVDGTECSSTEQVLFHIHAHLTIFVSGAARQVPYGIGIPNPQTEATPQGPFVGNGSCFYWLHTHAADGIIHIESPVRRTFTLGDFFDIWGQPLSATQVGPTKGTVTAIYNGQRYEGNPRNIPLSAHAQIQLDVGRPLVAPETITFPGGL